MGNSFILWSMCSAGAFLRLAGPITYWLSIPLAADHCRPVVCFCKSLLHGPHSQVWFVCTGVSGSSVMVAVGSCGRDSYHLQGGDGYVPAIPGYILGPTPLWIRVRRQKNFQLYLGENINLNLFLTCHININKKYFYYYYGLFDDFFLAVNGGVAFQDTMLKDNDIICNKVHRLEMSRNSKIYMCDAYRHTCTWVIELDHLS